MRAWGGASATRLALGAALVGLPAAPAAAGSPDWDAVSREAIGLLQRYVTIRSTNPPADSREAAAFLKEVLEREEIEVSTYEAAPGKVNLLARLPSARSGAAAPPAGAVLLLHHMDVVPVDAARWPVDPFGAEIRDGHLYGRGAMDMKALGVIHLMAFLSLKRQNVPLSRDLLLLATADEESGGEDGARWMIQHHWPQMAPEYVLDEGGFGSRDVLAADGRLVFNVSVAEKKILWARVVAVGTAGHGSQPIPDNANGMLVRALRSLSLGSPEARPTPVIRELQARVGKLAANKFTDAIQRDTVSITTLRSGVGSPPKANVIPSTAEATLDCRLMPDTDVDQFLRRLREGLGPSPGVELEPIYRMDETPVTPHDTPLFAAIERGIRAEHPEATVAPSLIPYGTDSNAFRVRGAKAYGITPMVVDAAILASMHGDAERIPVIELGRGARIFYNILKDFCGTETPPTLDAQ